MRWHDLSPAAGPARMVRVALVSPAGRARDTLVTLAAGATVELDEPPGDAAPGPAAQALRETGPVPGPARLAKVAVEPQALAAAGRADLLAGEAELERYTSGAAHYGHVVAWTGWCPQGRLADLRASLACVDAAAVELTRPAGVDPPTLLRGGSGLRASFTPLISTYGTVPYRDVDPTVPAGLAYVVMFGMMFADAGHGLLLLLAAMLLRFTRAAWLAPLRRVWPFLAGAGLAGTAMGVLCGEFFGPTGVLPVLWLSPLDEPIPFLAAGVGVGALLLAGSYVIGTVNRWREGGARRAVYAPSGLAGAALFAGLGALAAGIYLHTWALAGPGAVMTTVALLLAALGLYAASGGGGSGAAQTGVELFDLVVRLVANLVSFARLAAFGLTHAALTVLVWTGTIGLWRAGGVSLVAAVPLMVAGNAVTFALEGLVAGIQALRLEYYELFSRIFQSEGRPFRPWHLDVEEEVSR